MVARQHELESKLKQAEDAEARSRDLEGQLMVEKAKAQQAEADKRNAEIQLAEAGKESLAAYHVATNAISGNRLSRSHVLKRNVSSPLMV